MEREPPLPIQKIIRAIPITVLLCIAAALALFYGATAALGHPLIVLTREGRDILSALDIGATAASMPLGAVAILIFSERWLRYPRAAFQILGIVAILGSFSAPWRLAPMPSGTRWVLIAIHLAVGAIVLIRFSRASAVTDPGPSA